MIDQSMMPIGPLEPKDMVLKDEENPRALVNLVPEAVVHAIERIPTDYLDVPENQLRDLLLKKRKFAPSIQDHRIRFMFWKEYDQAQFNIRKMNMVYVYSGICSRDSFYLLLQNKERTAWMLCPPTDYVIQCEEMLHFGLEQLRAILAERHTSIGGTVDSKVAQVKLEIVKMLDSRVKGAVIQVSRNVNLNVNTPTGKPAPLAIPKIEEVDKRLKELEDQLQNLNPARNSSTLKTIDVEVLGESS